MSDKLTLVVDCGGTNIKAGLVDGAGRLVGASKRVSTPYPLSPQKLVDTIEQLKKDFPKADRATVGMPGMIRHGVVVHTPHYITKAGPFTEIDEDLKQQWAGFDMQKALAHQLNIPVKVLNDAEIHGYGVIKGKGLELVLTLGTGLGTAWYDNGVLAPHLEISHAPVRIGTATPGGPRKETLTYDKFIGNAVLKRIGKGHWSQRVATVVDHLRPVFWWDHLYLGGGNALNIAPLTAKNLGADVTIVPNESALIGGAKIWELDPTENPS